MAIGTAIQSGNVVLVRDEKGGLLCQLSGSLHGYTGSTVTVKQGNVLLVYSEKVAFWLSIALSKALRL